jgi:pyruvate formate lyase activating enzyme
MHPRLLQEAIELSLATGGCIKFDLKAFHENLHLALTGTSNRRTLENFALAALLHPPKKRATAPHR